MAVLFLMIPLVLGLSGFLSYRSYKSKKNKRRAISVNLGTFVILVMMIALCAVMVSAAETGDAEAAAPERGQFDMLAAGLSVGIAGIGGGIAVGGTAPAAIGAVSEDPKAFGKSLIFVALGESIALYGLVISIIILFA